MAAGLKCAKPGVLTLGDLSRVLGTTACADPPSTAPTALARSASACFSCNELRQSFSIRFTIVSACMARLLQRSLAEMEHFIGTMHAFVIQNH
jgi:hypothetical protein